MKTFFDIMDDADDQIRLMIQGWKMVQPEDIGLDRRTGYRFWISDEGLITTKDSDRTLQYYGGFEYIKSEYRCEMGDWVMYSSGSGRVQDCLDYIKGVDLAEDEMA